MALSRPHLPKPIATYQSPTAMFADSVAGRSPDSRAHSSCRRLTFPRATQWPSIRRYSFTVAGAVPGLVLVTTRTRTGFPFHLPSFAIDIERTAKHLTTSARMLTATIAVGKLQTRAALAGCLPHSQNSRQLRGLPTLRGSAKAGICQLSGRLLN